MISHTVPAAGVAGLIKAALALHHKVLPPTICENPNPKLQLENANLYINTETRPWIHGSSKNPRRAGVNAFGFGGINAHAILEEYTGPNQAPWMQRDWDSELFVFSGDSRAALAEDAEQALKLVREGGDALSLKNLAWTLNCNRAMGPVRMAVVGLSHADLTAKLERAIKRLGDEKKRDIKEKDGIYHFKEPLGLNGKLAFLFPGEGSQYRNMLGDLCIHFPEVRQVFDLMDRAYENHARDYLPSDVIFPPPLGSPSQERLYNMDSGAETVFCANQAMYALIERLGINADAMVGHSTGEHSALLASRVVEVADDEELIGHILGVYEVFDKLNSTSDIPEAVLLAVAGADHGFLEQQVAASNGELYIALDNCIHQVVLCGPEAVVDRLVTVLTPKGAICQKLPFARAYHTPWFEVFSKPLKQHFDRLRIGKAQTALYSCVTAGPYPRDAEEIRALAAVQWSSTVRFRETIEGMHRDGVRLFLEVGPRSNLTGFTDDVLRSKPHAAIPSNVQHRSGIVQLHHMLGQLVAHGLNPKLEHLYARRAPRPVTEKIKARRSLALGTGLQPARLPADFKLPERPQSHQTLAPSPQPLAPVPQSPVPSLQPPAPAPTDSRSALMQEHLSMMEQLLQTQQEVMAAYLAARQGNSSASGQAGGLSYRPFFHEVVENVPGVLAVALHRFAAEREIIFHDHALGRDVSTEDPSLLGLTLVPLTVTMEMLAEGGALLEPGKLLTGMRDIRASRWVTLEKPGYTVEATAKQMASGEVHVALREAGAAGTLRPILAEAVAVFAERYPDSGGPRPFALENEKPSAWIPAQLYRTGMFHGSLMQGAKSVERAGRNGTSATLEALPHGKLFTDNPRPAFLFDPVLLDAAGQVVAYWFWEAIEKGTDLFPYRVSAFHCYAQAPAEGAQLECRVVRRFESEAVIHSDIEVLDRAGKVYYRLDGWETRRFPQPPRFLRLRIDPRGTYISTPWKEPVTGKWGVAGCRVEDLPQAFLESSHSVWLKTLAYLVLNRRERAVFDGMQATAKERYDWLLGRCAAKDAVRMLIHERCGEQLCAADVEIAGGAYGRLAVEGAWKQRLGVNPVVEIANSGVAGAVAALDGADLAGIDLAPRAA